MSIEQEKLISMPLNNKQTKAIYKGKKKTKTTLFHTRFLNSIYKIKYQERRVSRDSGQESTARLLSTQPGFFSTLKTLENSLKYTNTFGILQPQFFPEDSTRTSFSQTCGYGRNFEQSTEH